MIITERSLAEIDRQDLQELYEGSQARLCEYFIAGKGKEKWAHLYDTRNPLAVALCQGAALHYVDKMNGVKDFDIWFFYPFNKKHLPYRSVWRWDYKNSKFGKNPKDLGYEGRRVDILVRSTRNFTVEDPARTIYNYLSKERSSSAKKLAKKAVVLIYPIENLGRVVWYKGQDAPCRADPGSWDRL